MENEEIRQYLIGFVEKTLNECESFTKVYGKDFVRKRLEINLNKVYTDISNNNDNTGFYDMDTSCITLFLNNSSGQTLSVEDIKNNRKLQHNILHEFIHAIFKRNKEECQKNGIESGTGILEFYKNGTELGRGLNEGLTEWICQKAGYGTTAYMAEKNIVRMIELAIGEDSVMKFANGNIRGNIANLLGMSEQECVRNLILVDSINRIEQNNHLEDYFIKLDRSISDIETIIFNKYFKADIEKAQSSQYLSNETMSRFFDLCFSINGGTTLAENSSLPLKFKNEIYPQLLENQRRQERRQQGHEQQKSDLPVAYKMGCFQKIKDLIKRRFMKKSKQYEISSNKEKINNQQEFKKHISNMSNYSKQSVIKHTKTNSGKSKLQNELEINDGQEL